LSVIVCPSCSQENPAGARFCSACGAALEASPAQAREERKVVTVLFADLVGFTARSELLDPEDVRGLLAPFHARLREELERFGGTVEKFIGDAVMALFGAPTAHEDDPERAVRAALAIRDWVGEHGNELQLRLAVNTGEALITLGARTAEGEGMAAGDVINTTARLQSAAPVNGILVGETTYRATKHVIEYREAEPVEAKGKSEPISVWEVVAPRSRYGVDLAEARAPLVGREAELDALRDALGRARSEVLQLVTLVGVPGIGKSRLVYELFQSIVAEPDFTTWRQGRSLPYGEGVSFWALAEIVKAEAGILESDSDADVEGKLRAAVAEVAADEDEADWLAARLGNLVGVQSTDSVAGASQAESFSAWRRFVEALADRRPLVLVFEDLHWADDGLLDFIDQLVDWARSAPILVLCTARPELLERRPGWGGGKANASTLSLPPLEDEDTARLLSALLERAVLPAETQSVLLARAEGNPLYAEQYARMFVERGDAAELPLPETVQGIIAARLDGLSDSEKALLQDASVVGKVFWLGSLRAIGGLERGPAEEALLGLERKELVQRARRSSVEGEGEYAFRHLLVRDVAYGQIPRAARADKHQAAAEWVEGLGRSDDHAEMFASHYSLALEYARAAGSKDGELSERARIALRDAGDRASSLQAWPAAAHFYTEALELWPEGDPGLPHLHFRCGRARFNADGTGLDMLEAAVDELEAAGDVEAAAQAAVVTGRSHWQRGEVAQHNAYIGKALELVGEQEESAARVTAIAAQAARHMFDGEFWETIALTDEGLPIAERLGLDEVRARLLELRGYARCTSGDAGGFADFEQAIALASEIHAFEQVHTAWNNLSVVQIGMGQLEAAQESLAAIKRNAERHATPSRLRWIDVLGVEFGLMDGNWAEVSRVTSELIVESEAGNRHYTDYSCRLLRATIRRASGDLPGAVADVEQCLTLARASADAQVTAPALIGAASVFLEAGRSDEAATLAHEALAMGIRLVVVSNDMTVVDAAWLMRDVGFQADYVALLEESLATPWVEAASAICSDEFRRAADVLGDIGCRTGEAYARLRAAKQLVEEGRRAEADVELNQALAFYREVGATAYVREGEALLAASA
jgi:class 3 adenylate cyclase/tetratricopeptide (TPR) repeat protein